VDLKFQSFPWHQRSGTSNPPHEIQQVASLAWNPSIQASLQGDSNFGFATLLLDAHPIERLAFRECSGLANLTYRYAQPKWF
jgi:hypothetical protein